MLSESSPFLWFDFIPCKWQGEKRSKSEEDRTCVCTGLRLIDGGGRSTSLLFTDDDDEGGME